MSIKPNNSYTQKFFGINYKKKLFIITLIAAIIIENSIIIYVYPIENKIVYTNWILLINSALSAGLSIILVINIFLKQKRLNLNLVSYITLSIGLILWFCANSEWVRYEIDEVVPDIPSIADILWISAYPFLGYSLYSTFRKFYKKYQNKKVFLMSLCSGILFVIYIFYIINRLSEFSTSHDIALLSIMIVYPILNTVLIVPAIVMLMGFKKEPEYSMPRMYESLSLLNLVVADSWFVIIFLSNLVEAIWYSNLLIVDHYLIISAGLLWSLIFLHPINSKFSFEWKNKFKFKNRIPRRIMLVISIPVLISSFLFVNVIYLNVLSYSSIENTEEIKIGALLGLSGISSERGKTQKASMEEAVKDINADFNKNGTNKEVVLYIEDTERKPDVALNKLKILAEKGIKTIIGPQTSSELKKIEEYADKHDILIISQSSTAPSLSKKGDNIFRLVQNDTNQGKEIATKMYNDGIRVVVPILRSDAYGNDLYNAVNVSFTKLGGKFTDAIKYNPHLGKFAGSLHRINFIMWNQDLKNLSLAVSNAIDNSSSNSSKVGVYVISYGEIVPILIQAQSYDNLKSVNWYGSDGTAKNEHLVKHNKAGEFAYTTNFTNPLMALNENNVKFKSLENDTNLKELNVYDANAYDALWVAALTENNSGDMTIKEVKDKFNNITKCYQGVSESIELDHNGDRLSKYDFWMVKDNIHNNNYEWEKVTGKVHN
jgi:branched-chain amino acid transport system substrate-binding protein